ncbi:MAG: neutral zinc metallopeptidase, partial [Novosphingobium sp.]
MRLDDFDPNAINVEDQRGGGGGLPIGRGGQVGCGTIVIALIAYFFFGFDPTQMIGSVQDSGPAPTQVGAPAGGTNASESCSVDQASRESCNALSSLNKTWQPVFKQANLDFVPPKLVFYSRAGRSGCGTAQSAMGPFYCPEDQGIYLDTDFYQQMDQQLGATGQFARDYVIAHEYGHHIQKLTGISDQIRSAQEQNPRAANQLSACSSSRTD